MSADKYIDDMSSARIMVVDDEPINLKLIEKTLEAHDYTNTVSIQDPRNVVDQYQAEKTDLILLDLNMPHIDGFTVLEHLRALEDPLLPPIIVLTAQKEREYLLKAFDNGARDYITKPFDISELVARVRTMLEVHLAHKFVHEQKATLNSMVRERTKQLLETRLQVVQKLGRASEYRDNETGQHILRVSRTAVLLATHTGWNEDECETLLHATPMHDVGKIGIPDKILLKPGKLDEEEWEIMKTHTTIGGHILADDNSDLLILGKEIALTHHEKWDGSGYPEGLNGENIPLSGRIVAIADVFDALISKRTYKDAWTIDKAIELIIESRGTHFDPKLISIFEKHIQEIIDIHRTFADSEE